MQIGVVYPQTEYGNDPTAIRDYAQIVEGLGFSHVLAYDHVLGANPNRPGGWQGVYTHENAFQDPFLLFSYMAAVTQKLQFATGIIILPQRQTALVAKQAACLDVLSAGRLRLGVGIGWNEIEYIALGQDFHNRGRRIEEQVDVLRKLWTMPLMTYEGRWHKIEDAGLNPLPVQRPIPIWFGGHADAVLQRAARLGDGWMPNYRTAEQAQAALESLARYLEQAGRDRSTFGIEARLNCSVIGPADWEKWMQGWQKAGATHITYNTMGCNHQTSREHLDALRAFARFFGLN
jgi:probable F420-dependent oxidoreductase